MSKTSKTKTSSKTKLALSFSFGKVIQLIVLKDDEKMTVQVFKNIVGLVR